MKKLFIICTAITLCILGSAVESLAQAQADSAVIRYGDHTTVAVTDFSSPIPIPANEVINITLHFRQNAAGQPVVIEAPDGGSVSAGNSVLVIGNNEQLTFEFKPRAGSVQSSVFIRQGAATFSLTFSVGAVQD